MTKASKGWLIALIICTALTYFLFNFASTESQKAIDNYDYSQIESYKGVITDIVKSVDSEHRVSYGEVINLENGEEIKIWGGDSADYDRIGEWVRVYTNRYHNIWAYSERNVAAEEMGEFVYYLPIFFTGTGIAFCFVGFCGSLNEKKRICTNVPTKFS